MEEVRKEKEKRFELRRRLAHDGRSKATLRPHLESAQRSRRQPNNAAQSRKLDFGKEATGPLIASRHSS